MSIFGLATPSNGKVNVDNSWLTPLESDPSVFKSLLNANLATQNISKSSTEYPAPHSGNDSGASINAFLMRLWQTEPAQNNQVDFSTPMKFVKTIAEPAKQAAAQLGTSQQVVIAIAALETGWGKHVIEVSEGRSSNNLFGIKSTNQHSNSTVFANTTEYIDGKKLTLEQPFRTYATAAESVGDFADFIRSNPRYENALLTAHDAQNFIDQIHHAGYATDPDYAAKVKSVLASVEKMMKSPHYQQLN